MKSGCVSACMAAWDPNCAGKAGRGAMSGLVQKAGILFGLGLVARKVQDSGIDKVPSPIFLQIAVCTCKQDSE